MTEKAKARELVNKFRHLVSGFDEMETRQSKQCALIAVDEILTWSLPYVDDKYFERELTYWQQVRKEIEAL